MQTPDVHYARSGDVAIAYQAVGEGPVDIVFARGYAGDLLSSWDQPLLVRHILGLASLGRVLMLDKRGTGLSDRVREVPTLETRMDDLRAVMDDAGSERAVIWSGEEGARLAVLFAATYPERTAGLVMFDPSARGRRSPDYPWAPTDEEWRRQFTAIREGWGRREFLEELAYEWAPEAADDEAFRGWFVGHIRRSLSPGAALAFQRMMMEADVSDVLSAVRVPTTILYRTSQRGRAEYVARRLHGAELVELPGLRGIYTWAHDSAHELTMAATRTLVSRAVAETEPDRVLATVLFTDLVGATERAVQLGDGPWRGLLEEHHRSLRRELARFRGREVDMAGDGVFATFDGPARGILCARAILESARELGLDVRAGLHTGECEVLGDKVVGIAVHVGARVAAAAGPGEVLVSSTVRDLVAGSGLQFDDRGEHELKGVPESKRLFAVID
jgi:class 3 adenylate cyclase/pimeloyl-ACP methyl ester carboxylesterase